MAFRLGAARKPAAAATPRLRARAPCRRLEREGIYCRGESPQLGGVGRCDLVVQILDATTERVDHDNENTGDAGGNHRIFDGSRAALVEQETADWARLKHTKRFHESISPT